MLFSIVMTINAMSGYMSICKVAFCNGRHKSIIIIIASIIRKYGSTFYIGIAMVVLPYIGPWEN